MCFLFEEELKGYYKRSGIPHYDNDKVYQFITFRLHDSIPQQVIEYKKSELAIMKKSIDKNSCEYERLQQFLHRYEDNGYGQCYLKNPKVYEIVENALKYFDKVRYDLIEMIIMPNHVHVLIGPYESQHLHEIIQSWKSFTAKKANQLLKRKGKFWMDDYFDRYIRNEDHYFKVINYIKNNGKKRER